MALVGEAGLQGDFAQRQLRVPEQFAGAVDAQVEQPGVRRQAAGGLEAADQVVKADTGFRRDRIEVQRFGMVCSEECLHAREPLRRHRLGDLPVLRMTAQQFFQRMRQQVFLQ